MTASERAKSGPGAGRFTSVPRGVQVLQPDRRNLLNVDHVTVRFGGLVALSDVSISVPQGGIVGLVGPNGAGKSTLFNVISGIVRPSAGRVVLDGADIMQASIEARARLGIARTFQHPEVFSSLTVRESTTLAYRMRYARSRIWRDLLVPVHRRAGDTDEEKAVSDVLELVGLDSVGDCRAAGLPLGYARRLEMARAIVMSPKVILLDEPSSGLDSTETRQFSRMLRMLSQERGVGLLLVEHNVGMVLELCERIHVLDFGIGIAAGSPDEIRQSEAVHAAYFGRTDAGHEEA